MKVYKIMIQGYDDTCGVMYAPSDWPYPIALDGEEVKNWQSLRLELKDGIYCPFHCCVGCANVINEEMKNLMEKYIDNETQVEFLPVKAHSDEYGEKQYYILHFLKIHDVIDTEHTVYSDINDKDSVIKLAFSCKKVKNLHLFNSRPLINDVYISEKLYKDISKHNLTKGISFQAIKCF